MAKHFASPEQADKWQAVVLEFSAIWKFKESLSADVRKKIEEVIAGFESVWDSMVGAPPAENRFQNTLTIVGLGDNARSVGRAFDCSGGAITALVDIVEKGFLAMRTVGMEDRMAAIKELGKAARWTRGGDALWWLEELANNSVVDVEISEACRMEWKKMR